MSVTASALEMYVIWSLMNMTDVSGRQDRKSTRLNSSHQISSYAVCKIVKIGPDIILVEVEEKEVRKKIQQ